ncbi:MAG: FkbM family methyltransferase, partial [Saprospiraceae bacterium]
KSLNRLKQLGFNPKTVFDVGAYEGEFADTCLDIWPHSNIYCFEVLEEKVKLLKEKFKNKNVVIQEGIVGDENKEEVKYFSDETASSVLFSEETDTRKKILNKKMFTLESLILKNSILPDLLKIDTQGFEYPILKGMGNYLNSVEVILLELNYLDIYFDVKLAHEVIAYLSGLDFVMYDICEIHRRPLDDALVQADYIFVKRNSIYRANKKWSANTIK